MVEHDIYTRDDMWRVTGDIRLHGLLPSRQALTVECTKCKTAWFRKDLDSDLICVNCGALYIYMPPTSPVPPQPPRTKNYDDRTKTVVYDVVKVHFDYISGMIQQQETWYKITEQLKNRTKRKLYKDVVEKYYEMIRRAQQ